MTRILSKDHMGASNGSSGHVGGNTAGFGSLGAFFKRAAGVGMALVILWSVQGVFAQSEPSLEARPPEKAWLELAEKLLEDDWDDRLDALEKLREDPETARETLLYLLENRSDEKEQVRWAFHLNEFGEPEDITLLETLVEKTEEIPVQNALRSTMQSLYQAANPKKELDYFVNEFTFIQSKNSRPIRENRVGRWRLSPWSFQVLHREGVSVSVIDRLRSVSTTSFESRELLEAAMKKRLRDKVWEEYEGVLKEIPDQVQQIVTLEGRVRVGLSNPLERPLLVRVAVGVWFGRFKTPPPERWVLVPAGASKRVDLPVQLQGVRTDHGLRLDLRLREVNGGVLPSFQTLGLGL